MIKFKFGDLSRELDFTDAAFCAQLEQAGQQLIRALSDLRWRDAPVKACCSIGICRAADTSIAYKQLYEQADQALYEAKRRGKGRCFIFRNN